MLKLLRREWKILILAFGFLTRLAPARHATEQELEDSVRYYPAVGLVLGCILAAPFIFGVGKGFPWAQAFLYLCLNLWLTRGLHFDGLADLADAWASLKSGEQFWRVLKDSRIGAFGCLAIVLAILGTLISTHEILATGSATWLILPPILARAAALLFMAVTPVSDASTLAKILASGSTPITSTAWLGVALLLGFITKGLLPSTAALIFSLLLVAYLKKSAHEAGGMNGDFIGALIVLSEIGSLFCLTLI